MNLRKTFKEFKEEFKEKPDFFGLFICLIASFIAFIYESMKTCDLWIENDPLSFWFSMVVFFMVGLNTLSISYRIKDLKNLKKRLEALEK